MSKRMSSSKLNQESTNRPYVLRADPQPGICLLTLNRPTALNALSPMDALELCEMARKVNADESVRCVILTGSGRGFCAGANLAGEAGVIRFTDPQGKPVDLPLGQAIAYNMEKAYNPMSKALYELEKPFIVAVNGVAAGGGAGLALLADFVIAAESAKFVQVFAPKLGLAPDLGTTWTLPRTVGRAKAMGLAFTGDPLSAKEAERIGMIWKCVPDSDLMKEAMALAERLSRGPTLAFHKTRVLFDQGSRTTLQEQLALEKDAQEYLGNTADFDIGVKMFRGQKNLKFTGKKPSSKL